MPETILNIRVSVDCVIFGYDEAEDKLEVLLTTPSGFSSAVDQPSIPHYSLPGVPVGQTESFDAAAARALKRFTQTEGIILNQFYCFGDPERTVQEKDREWMKLFHTQPETRVITVSYFALVRKEMIQPIDNKMVTWLSIKHLPALAFDHNLIVKKATSDLRDHIYLNDYAQQLLPEKFTLRQLQRLYETILNTEFDKRNFVKRIKKDGELIGLNEKQQGVMHKPAQLFSFKTKKRKV
jgi:8-oxo-dGTP diphosphatase